MEKMMEKGKFEHAPGQGFSTLRKRHLNIDPPSYSALISAATVWEMHQTRMAVAGILHHVLAEEPHDLRLLQNL